MPSARGIHFWSPLTPTQHQQPAPQPLTHSTTRCTPPTSTPMQLHQAYNRFMGLLEALHASVHIAWAHHTSCQVVCRSGLAVVSTQLQSCTANHMHISSQSPLQPSVHHSEWLPSHVANIQVSHACIIVCVIESVPIILQRTVQK